MKIKTIPEEIITQATFLSTDESYSSRYRQEVIRQLIGVCVICSGIPAKYIIEKRQGIEVISRYCGKCYVERSQKQQKYKRKRKK